MKKSILKLMSLCCAAALAITAAGCGTRVEETSTWIDGEGKTVTITHSGDSSGGESTIGKNEGRAEGGNVKDNGGTSESFDLKGAQVVIARYTTGDDPNSASYQDEQKLISDIEAKYNCKIVFKDIADSMGYLSAWVTAAQSGIKFADIVTLATSWSYPTHMSAGYLTKLDDLLDLNSNIYNKTALEQTAYKGSHYLTVMSNRLYVEAGIFFNKSIFSKFNQKTPDKYVAENNWNWNSFLELAKATTGSKNGVNYYGFALSGGSAVQQFAKSNGGRSVVYQDGKYKFNMGSESYIEGIQFAYDLVHTHHVTPVSLNDSVSMFKSGEVAMLIGSSFNGSSFIEALGSSNVGFTYIPKGPDVSDYNIRVEETTSYGIPSTVKNPKAIAAIMYDYTYPYKWRPTLEQQLENHFGDAKSLQTAMDIGIRGNKNLDLKPLYSYISRTVGWSDFGISSKTSPQAYIASVTEAAQAELDQVWEQ